MYYAGRRTYINTFGDSVQGDVDEHEIDLEDFITIENL